MKRDNYLCASTFKILPFIMAVLLVTTGCSKSSGGGSGGGSAQPVTGPAITIDNAGVVPVFGNSSTTSVVYVHNNSNVAISGIKYDTYDNAVAKYSKSLSKNVSAIQSHLGLLKLHTFVSKSSAQLCSSIPAGQSCPLTFTTPILLNKEEQGSVLITATYNQAGNSVKFDQVVNYMKVQDNKQGALINSGVQVSGFDHHIGYATLYMYGGGTNQTYHVNSMVSNNKGIRIIQGDITGRNIQSNYVQVIEVSAPVGKSGFVATLTANSQNISATKQYTSHAMVGVDPVANGAILTAGTVPLIDTSVESPAGRLFIVNAGNDSATSISITPPAGITIESGESDSCGVSLASYGSCTIYFTISQGSSGSSYLSISYNAGTLNQTVTWYNSKGGPLLQMSANPNPMVLLTTQSGSTVVTVTNIGGYSLTNVTIPNPTTVDGTATAIIESGSTCTGNLPIGTSCSYTVNVVPNIPESGFITLGISGNYAGGTSSYHRVLGLSYFAESNAAILDISSARSMTIAGDTISTDTQTITVTNIGTESAVSIVEQLSNTPESAMTIQNSCASILAPNESCSVDIQLGPVAESKLESGIATYTVDYTSTSLPASGVSSYTNIPYTITANDQSVKITMVTATGSESGSGEESNSAFIFNGASTSSKAITLTLYNTGTNTMTIRGVNNTNSPIAWQMDSNSSSCSIGTALGVGESCTIVFNNVLAQNILAESAGAAIGASYSQNLLIPSFVLSANGEQFVITPPLPSSFVNGIVYATGHQATVANNVVLESAGTPDMSVVVSHSLANAESYAAITITSSFEDYFTGAGSLSSGCTVMNQQGIRTQTCTLNSVAGNDNGSGRYLVDRRLLPESGPTLLLHTLFSVEANSQTVAMNKLYSTMSVYTTRTVPRFAYVANQGSNNISMYNVRESDGFLQPMSPATIRTGSRPYGIAVHPSGNFAYVANYFGNTVSMYTIRESDGILESMTTPTIATERGPFIIAIDPTGRFAYVTNSTSNNVSMYNVRESDGVLESMTTPTISAGSQPYYIAIDPTGRFAYVANSNSNNISMYTIESTGVLKPMTTPTIGTGAGTIPLDIKVDSSGKFLYVVNRGGNSVSTFAIDQTTGNLSTSRTFSNISGNIPYSIALHPSNRFAYISNFTSGSLTLFSFDQATGVLTYESVATTESSPHGLAIDRSGQFAYATNVGSGSVSIYRINQNDGSLAATSKISTGASPYFIVMH